MTGTTAAGAAVFASFGIAAAAAVKGGATVVAVVVTAVVPMRMGLLALLVLLPLAPLLLLVLLQACLLQQAVDAGPYGHDPKLHLVQRSDPRQ